MVEDVWNFWRKAKRDPSKIGSPELPIHPDDPQIGYFRFLDKRAGKWVPCAFFTDDDGLLRCHVDGREIEPLKFGDIWNRVCEHPIGYDEYARAVAGLGWNDEPPPAVGDNISGDVAEQLRLEFEAEFEIAKELLAQEITDQDTADRAAILSKRMSYLRKRADEKHDEEKRPALEESRRIDDRWRFREEMSKAVTDLKRRLESWLDSHESAGRTGAKVSLRTFMVGEITHVELFFGFVKELPEIREALQKVANRLAKAGLETPGMDIKEERRAI